MDILIIGNGFDLAHGLKTSYKDFLEHCTSLPPDDELRNNLWLKHFINRQASLGDTWIDLETEIYDVIKQIAKGNMTYPSTQTISDNFKIYYVYKDNKTFRTIDKFHFYNTADLAKYLYDRLRDFTKAFEKYLLKNVLSTMNNQSKYRLKLHTLGVQQGSKDVRVLSFNYTDTCERLYKHKFNTYCELVIKPLYIHGKVCDSDDCNLVLGTNSFDDNNNIPLCFNAFKKHNQRHKFATIEVYQDFLKELTDPRKLIKPTFHIIGHSLDKTDHKILKHIFLTNKNATINIYYHNEEAQERLINNITDIIGEEEVMAKVRLVHQHDQNRGLLLSNSNNSAQIAEPV